MNILTFHPYKNLKRVFANRDVGQIGKHLARAINGMSYVWCLRELGQEDFHISDQKWIGHKNFLCMFFRLAKARKKFAVLHLFHISWRSLLACLIYKFSNSGFIVLKADLSSQSLGIADLIGSVKFRALANYVDYFGLDDQETLRLARRLYPNLQDKFWLLTGGIDQTTPFDLLNKEKAIVMCGRFGDLNKNYELFLQALAETDMMNLRGWKIYLIGTRTEEFDSKISRLMVIRPYLKDSFFLLGELVDAGELSLTLSRGKIFVHTSLSEGDPNIQYEAMWCGCVLVSSDVGSISQNYPKNYRYLFNPRSKEHLIMALNHAIEYCSLANTDLHQAIHNHAQAHFTWQKVVRPIADVILTDTRRKRRG